MHLSGHGVLLGVVGLGGGGEGEGVLGDHGNLGGGGAVRVVVRLLLLVVNVSRLWRIFCRDKRGVTAPAAPVFRCKVSTPQSLK